MLFSPDCLLAPSLASSSPTPRLIPFCLHPSFLPFLFVSFVFFLLIIHSLFHSFVRSFFSTTLFSLSRFFFLPPPISACLLTLHPFYLPFFLLNHTTLYSFIIRLLISSFFAFPSPHPPFHAVWISLLFPYPSSSFSHRAISVNFHSE